MVEVVVSGLWFCSNHHHHQYADSAVAPVILSELPGTSWVGTAVSDWLSQQTGTGPGGAVVRTVETTQLQPDLNRKVESAHPDCMLKTRSGAVTSDPRSGSIPGG